MKKVVVTENIHADGIALLEARDDIELSLLDGTDHAQIAAEIIDADAVLVRTAQLTAAELSPATNLQVVSRHGVGCDNVDVSHMTSRGLPVAIAAEANSTSVAEHVLMMMLTLCKRAEQYDQLTRSGGFHERGRYKTFELQGKHILIIGYGRIGKKVAPLCRAFGMRVTVADIELDRVHAEATGCKAVEDFAPALADADFVTLHVPLDDTTRNLIGTAELAAMPAHAILINCARGGVVDELAVAKAVLSDTLGGFGSDVFTAEPPASDNPLLSLPNSVLSPHNAATTAEGFQRMATGAAQNILDCFDGKLTAPFVFNARELGWPQ
jgi:D-3-phosphoglycerate dehydrogenase